jgi:hypothetical protein
MLVPCMVVYAVSLELTAERMFTPGATMFGFITPLPVPGPLLLKEAMVSLELVAPTV